MTLRLTRRSVISRASTTWLLLMVTGCGGEAARPGLYIAGPDGAPRWIDDTTGAPAWSTSGKAIAWGDENGLKTWGVDSGRVDTLMATPVVGRPAWEPNGTALAFLDGQARVLQSINTSSRASTPLAVLYSGPDGVIRPPIVTRGGPAWAPDGTRIAFVCWDGQGDEICIVDADGNGRQQITSLGGLTSGSGNIAGSSATSVAWSPDSVALVVAVQAEQRGATSGIFRVDLAKRSGQRLTNMTANSPVVWDSASDDLIFSARVEGHSDVYRLPATGGTPKATTTVLPDGARDPTVDAAGDLAVVSRSKIAVLSTGSDGVTWHEQTGLMCAAPALSPDGRQLAFLALPQPIAGYP